MLIVKQKLKYLHKQKETDKTHCNGQLAQEDAVDFANKTYHRSQDKSVNNLLSMTYGTNNTPVCMHIYLHPIITYKTRIQSLNQ